MYRRHEHRIREKDPTALPLRILCALLGLTFGFAGGRLYGPESLLPEERKPVPVARAAPESRGMGVPVRDRIQNVLRMDRDALAGLLAAIQQEYEAGWQRPEVRDRTELHLRTLFDRWADLDALGAMKAAQTLKNRAFSNAAVLALYAEWARRDPAGAVQSLAGLPQASAQRAAAHRVVQAAVARDPVALLALVPKISGAPRPLLMSALGAEWMRLDAGHALRRMMTEPVLNPALSAGRALGGWMLADAGGWAKWRRGNPALADAVPTVSFDAEEWTPGRLTALGGALTELFGAGGEAGDWLSGASNFTGREVLAALLPPAVYAETYMKQWKAGAEKRAPFSTISGWLERLRHAGVMRALAARFAEEDPAAALAWAAAMPPDEGAPAAALIAGAWLADAPASAPAKLFSGDMTSPAGRAGAAAAVNRLVRSDPAKALDSLPGLKLEPALTASLQTGALMQLSRTAPARLLEWLAAHPEIKPSPEIIAPALKSVAASDPARALEHVRAHSAATAIPAESAAIVGVWLTRDRAGALSFLRTLPDGPERDACTEVLAAVDIAMTDPFFAANVLPESFEAALRLREKDKRQSTLRALLARMKQLNVPAQSVLSLPGLRPEDRDAIKKS